MSMDWLPWVIRAILIVTGILAIIVGKKKKGYSFGVFTIGITALTMGVILLVVSFVTNLSFGYDFYLIAAGAIAIIMGFVIRIMWDKKH